MTRVGGEGKGDQRASESFGCLWPVTNSVFRERNWECL